MDIGEPEIAPLVEVRQTLVIHSKQMQATGMQIMQLCSGGKKGSEVGWDGHNECDQNRQFMAAPCSIHARSTSTSCADIDFLPGGICRSPVLATAFSSRLAPGFPGSMAAPRVRLSTRLRELADQGRTSAKHHGSPLSFSRESAERFER